MDNKEFKKQITLAFNNQKKTLEGTINQANKHFKTKILEIARKCFPRHKNLTRRKSNPWLNQKCEHFFRKRSEQRHKLNTINNTEQYKLSPSQRPILGKHI
jgi:hypothetical protein